MVIIRDVDVFMIVVVTSSYVPDHPMVGSYRPLARSRSALACVRPAMLNLLSVFQFLRLGTGAGPNFEPRKEGGCCILYTHQVLRQESDVLHFLFH